VAAGLATLVAVASAITTSFLPTFHEEPEIKHLIQQAQGALAAGRLIEPEGNSALAYLRKAREKAAEPVRLRKLVAPVVQRYAELAEQALQHNDPQASERYAQTGMEVAVEFSVTADKPRSILDKIARARVERQVDEWVRLASTALKAGRLNGPGEDHALAYADRIEKLVPGHKGAKDIARQVALVLSKQARDLLRAGDQSAAAQRLVEAQAIATDFSIDVAEVRALAGELAESKANAIEAAEHEKRLTAALERVDEALSRAGLGDSDLRELDAAVNKARALAPEDPRVQQRMVGVRNLHGANELFRNARQGREDGALAESLALVEQALKLAPDAPELVSFRETVIADLRLERHERVRDLIAEAHRLIETGARGEALELVREGRTWAPDDARLAKEEDKLTARLAEAQQLSAKLSRCAALVAADALTTKVPGHSGTALVCYREVLDAEPENEEALAGLQQMAEKYVGWISSNLEHRQVLKARKLMKRLRSVDASHPKLAELEARANAIQRSLRGPTRQEPIKIRTTQMQPSQIVSVETAVDPAPAPTPASKPAAPESEAAIGHKFITW
jgi:tetratricopeptide (TPR) repeat protein